MKITKTQLKKIIKEELGRVINEEGEFVKELKAMVHTLEQNKAAIKIGPDRRAVQCVPKANITQGPCELLLVTNVRKKDEKARQAQKTAKDISNNYGGTLGYDCAGRMSILLADTLDHLLELAPDLVEWFQDDGIEVSHYGITHLMVGLPCRRTTTDIGYSFGEKVDWVNGLQGGGQAPKSAYSLTLARFSGGKQRLNKELIQVARMNDKLMKNC